MNQLPLDIRLADHALFSNFLSRGNDLVVHELKVAASQSHQPMLWLWGLEGSGRSHLLQACTGAAEATGRRSVFIPLHRSLAFPPKILDGLGDLDLVVLDDVDAIAGEGPFEQAVFSLYEELGQSGGAWWSRRPRHPAKSPSPCRIWPPE